MQIRTARNKRILPPNQRREFSGFVVSIGRFCNQSPGIHLDSGLAGNQSTDAILLPTLHRGHSVLRGFGQNRGKQFSACLLIDGITQQILYEACPQSLS